MLSEHLFTVSDESMFVQEINQLLESVEVEQQQFCDYCQPDQLNLDASIPITFTKDNRKVWIECFLRKD